MPKSSRAADKTLKTIVSKSKAGKGTIAYTPKPMPARKGGKRR